jgi:hypothetical protein
MGDVIGGDKDELRRDKSICYERGQVREPGTISMRIMEYNVLTIAETKARHVSKAVYDAGTGKWLFICHTYKAIRSDIMRDKRDLSTGNIWVPCQFDCSQSVPLVVSLPSTSWTVAGRLGLLVYEKKFAAMSGVVSNPNSLIRLLFCGNVQFRIDGRVIRYRFVAS